jgi:hypothetical protein
MIDRNARPEWMEVHPTVRQVMMDAQVNGMWGIVTNFFKGRRMEITFDVNTQGDEIEPVAFWFDVSQVVMRVC